MTDLKLDPDLFHSRLAYSPITQRPPLRLPNGERVVVWTMVNVENWLCDNTMPRAVLPPPMGQALLPDVPNWAWHEYGMRVGFWRLLETLNARDIKASLLSTVRPVAFMSLRAALLLKQAGTSWVTASANARCIKLAIKTGRSPTLSMLSAQSRAKRPASWESPGLTETADTLDKLAAAGIEYVCDWCLDDQPVTMRTKAGPIVSVPYTVEVNDVVMTAIQGHRSDEIYRRGVDQFDRLYLDGATTPRVTAISVHPYLTGVPHRIKYLEMLYDYILQHDDIALMTGAEIVDWYNIEMVKVK